METPVVLIIYNRPDTTAQVFEAVRQARPTTLFVLADGPRAKRPDDAERCAATRAIIEGVDWPCDVHTDFAPVNLGIKQRVDSGLDWVFSQVEEAIILEDDCVPHPDFFPFCQAMLARYRSAEQVMSIGGTSFLFNNYQPPYSYFFTRYPITWGWATWRRAWQRYDPAMTAWPNQPKDWLNRVLSDLVVVNYWGRVFKVNYRTLENWDYAWIFACWLHQGLCITPEVNLVSNIGFRPDASHTRDPHSQFAQIPTTPLPFPLRHPLSIERDAQADATTEQSAYSHEYMRALFTAARDALRAQRQGVA